MQDVKLAEVSAPIKWRGCMKNNTNELERKIKNANIRDLHRGVNEFEKDYHPNVTW
jgi:hypothetical protein